MGRLLKRKKVAIFGSDDSIVGYVDIPVIAEMDIIGSRGQEFRYRFINDSRTKLRTVRVKKVGSAHGASVSFERYVNAERIQTMAFTGTVDDVPGAWRTDKKFKNLDPAPKQPDGSDDPRHKKVHYVRYYANNDLNNENWIDVEMIDQMDVLGTNAQEYGFKLKNPTSDEYAEMGGDRFGQQATDDDPYMPIIGFCDQSLELLDIESDEDTGNPFPARLDPFQNIVNVHSEERTDEETPVVRGMNFLVLASVARPYPIGITVRLLGDFQQLPFVPGTNWDLVNLPPVVFAEHNPLVYSSLSFVHIDANPSGLSINVNWGQYPTVYTPEETYPSATVDLSGVRMVGRPGSGLPTLHPVSIVGGSHGDTIYESWPIFFGVKFVE